MKLFDEDTLITRELVDLIAPEHGRTSCSDEDPSNWYQNGQGYVRCIRCSLLKHLDEPISALPVHLHISVDQTPKTVAKVVHEIVRDS